MLQFVSAVYQVFFCNHVMYRTLASYLFYINVSTIEEIGQTKATNSPTVNNQLSTSN